MSIIGFFKKIFESDTVEEALRKWLEEREERRKNEGKLPEEPKLPEKPKPKPDTPEVLVLPEEPKLPPEPKLPEEPTTPSPLPPEEEEEELEEEVEEVFTVQKLKIIFPTTPTSTFELYVDSINQLCEKYNINNLNRRAMFIAQIGHESAYFKYVREGLKMSAARIKAVWPNRFATEEDAAPYANNPEALANKVYSNRMGNGTEESGDGWTYRGRGLIQVTGKENYSAFARSIGMSLDEVVSYLETPAGAVESAFWYWKTRNLNECADADDIRTCTKKINGGYTGLEDRTRLYTKAKQVLA